MQVSFFAHVLQNQLVNEWRYSILKWTESWETPKIVTDRKPMTLNDSIIP